MTIRTTPNSAAANRSSVVSSAVTIGNTEAESFAQMFEATFDCTQSPMKVADSTQRMWQKYRNSRLRQFSHCQ